MRAGKARSIPSDAAEKRHFVSLSPTILQFRAFHGLVPLVKTKWGCGAISFPTPES
jgi:hypothetical protein